MANLSSPATALTVQAFFRVQNSLGSSVATSNGTYVAWDAAKQNVVLG